jgi:hypothetical protein
MCELPGLWNQAAYAGDRWPGSNGQLLVEAAKSDQDQALVLAAAQPFAQELPTVVAERGQRADGAQPWQVGHGHSRRRAQEALGTCIRVQHLAMNCRCPVLAGEEMGKELGPVQRAHRHRRDAGACGTGQRQVGDVAEHQIGLQLAEEAGVTIDQAVPVGMLTAIGERRRLEVEADGIVHHVAEVAALLQVGEVGRDARLQLVGGQAAADGQTQFRQTLAERVEHRRRLRQVAESVRRDVDKKVCRLPHCWPKDQTKRASIAPGNSVGRASHTLWPLPGATRISAPSRFSMRSTVMTRLPEGWMISSRSPTAMRFLISISASARAAFQSMTSPT